MCHCLLSSSSLQPSPNTLTPKLISDSPHDREWHFVLSYDPRMEWNDPIIYVNVARTLLIYLHSQHIR